MDFPEDWSMPDNIIYRLDLESGVKTEFMAIPVPPKELASPAITPDGRTLVFIQRKTETDIWLVEDFDPGIK
jgi:hypothetical protein